MKKINKLILLGFLSIMMCGCSATYNLEYTSEGIKETLLINQEEVDLEEVKMMYYPMPVNSEVIVEEDDLSNLDEDEPLYQQDFIKINNGYQVKYSYDNYTDKLLAKSNAARKGFKTTAVTTLNATKQIATSKSVLAFKAYPELTDLTVNITTDYVVLNHNADKVSNNTYTWYFTRDNHEDKSVYLLTSMETSESAKEEEKEEQSSSSSTKEDTKQTSLLVLFGFLAGFLVIMIILFKVKKAFY